MNNRYLYRLYLNACSDDITLIAIYIYIPDYDAFSLAI